MSNIKSEEAPIEIRLGDQMVVLDYSMASIHYLAEKHGDVLKLFDKSDSGLNADYIERIADVMYAGLLRLDDDGNDTSGWTRQKVMSRIRMDQVQDIAKAFKRGMNISLPVQEGAADPTEDAATKTN